ncbi:MAG TPA: hypothetical protein VF017_22305 [Thermoanaerobaculia bacterium]|nr:hypothetical protein [Thermoanaerobaculia bacterium]
MRTPYALTPPRDGANSYLRRERDRKRWRELLVVVITLLPFGAGLLIYTWIQVQTLAAGYRITDLERRARELARERQHLELTLAERSRAAAVEAVASGDLGMSAQSADQTLYLEDLP